MDNINSVGETIEMLQILLDQAEGTNSKDTHIYDVNHDSFKFVIKQAMFYLAVQGETIKALMDDKEIAEIVKKKCMNREYGGISDARITED